LKEYKNKERIKDIFFNIFFVFQELIFINNNMTQYHVLLLSHPP